MKTLEIEAFSDGSSTVYKNKDNNRYGGIGVYFEHYPEYNMSDSYIGEDVSNQKMEIKAAIDTIEQTLKIVGEKSYWKLTIYTDSMYVINIVEKWAPNWVQLGWKRAIGNKIKDDLCHIKLVKKLYKLSKLYNVKYVHVRAHQKQPMNNNTPDWKRWYGNNQADKLATSAMENIKGK